jgi:predicted DsbA family dithiol-disulfide isomerase
VEKIRFHFDPRCPWCYQTARWARRLEELGEFSIDWALFSLEVVNRAEDVDPLTIDARSGPALRSAVLLRERMGRDAVGDLYRAFGLRVWESDLPLEVNDLDGIRDSLKEIGADPSLLDEALENPKTWEAVVQEHEELVGRTGAFGVPTIVLDDGAGPAIFGPVIYELPSDEEAVELWRHTTWLVRNDNFAELKRGRGGLPDLPAMEYRVRQYAERGGQRAAR